MTRQIPYDELSHTAQHKVMTALRNIRRTKANLMYFGVLQDTFEAELKSLEEMEETLIDYISRGVHKGGVSS